MKEHSQITISELKRLLIELREKRPDIGFRYRLLGEMWVVNFMTIVSVHERSVIFNDEVGKKVCIIPSLTNILQFEIDEPFQNFQPHFHYEVRPASEIERELIT